eukprot:NODE_33_length_32023_cov_0.217579.p4 type:complete len:525 gc:universal NODE_33_length_32023_cov_0.217579:15722-17296(+)
MQQVKSVPFQDQKPGTSGLRKKTRVFMEPNYTEHFLSGCLDILTSSGDSFLIGGDGRYYNKTVIQTAIEMASVYKKPLTIYIGQNGILSTPAASYIIRKNKLAGGILLTASHNPGGIDEDFGIKLNGENGGPASEQVTDLLFKYTLKIDGYKIHKRDPIDLDKISELKIENLTIKIIDSTSDYLDYMKTIFDFNSISNFIKSQNFSILFDAMNGVTGPYAKSIFKSLGLEDCTIRNVPLPDFGKSHPDPNLTYAKELVDKVKANKIQFGAASDGDGDRNMIISFDQFVSPGDSVAVIAHHHKCIPYFKNGLKGVARSMPTSKALDNVAEKLNLQCYETPTGWKYFGNLMDAEKLSICGEESFGTGSDHIREKDGLWAILAWLSIVAHTGLSVKEILTDFWKQYGRYYFTRYDYEQVSAKDAKLMMDHILTLKGDDFKVDEFTYTDPIDNSVSSNQGIRLLFRDKSRVIFRLSGTGSSGATVRMYVDKYDKDYLLSDALDGLINRALDLSKLPEYIHRSTPTVIT